MSPSENPHGRVVLRRLIWSRQVQGLPLFGLPDDVVELAHSRTDFGSQATASRVVRS
jgi:hypothetical protein